MDVVKIKHQYMDNKFVVVDKINMVLNQRGVHIELVDYDDSRVYFTGERVLATRLDCSDTLR